MINETNPDPDRAPVPMLADLVSPGPATPGPSNPGPSNPDPSGPEQMTYEDFVLPDGMTIDAEALERARALFGEVRLPQAHAQKFIDLAVERERAAAERGLKAFLDLQKKWVSELKEDPDIGGEQFAATVAAAARAIDRLAIPGLKDALNVTGAGNHPAIVKVFVRLGQMIAEDRFQPGGDTARAAPRSPADVIYDGNPRR
jgi:hypothetical protein